MFSVPYCFLHFHIQCSIDGLLDRTIQHMLFLRSVTDQADKLRQVIHQEVNTVYPGMRYFSP